MKSQFTKYLLMIAIYESIDWMFPNLLLKVDMATGTGNEREGIEKGGKDDERMDF